MSAEHRISIHPAGDLRGASIDGKHFLCGPEGRWLHGIDVSHHQTASVVDWAKESEGDMGVSWAYARATYGMRPDAMFGTHVDAIRAAGLRVGGYLFYRQTQPATDQLKAFTDQLKVARVGCGDLAPCLDVEPNTQYDGKPVAAKFNADAQWIAERIADEFGQCFVYLSPGFWQTLRRPDWMLRHPWWVAHYGKTLVEPWMPPELNGKVQWCAWQYQGAPLDRNFARSLPLASKGPVYLPQ